MNDKLFKSFSVLARIKHKFQLLSAPLKGWTDKPESLALNPLIELGDFPETESARNEGIFL